MKSCKTITITLNKPPQHITGFLKMWMCIGSLVTKCIVERHSYETKHGDFTVSIGKQINIKQIGD